MIKEAPPSDRMRVFDAVAEMLGIDSHRFAPTFTAVARRLGVSYDRMRYIVMRESRLKEQQRARRAIRAASQLQGSTATSRCLGFRIWLPEGWEATTDTDCLALLGQPNARIVGTSGYWRAEATGVGVGVDDALDVEVSGLRLDRELSALELCEAHRPGEDHLSWSTLRKRTPLLGGMQAVCFYGRWLPPDAVDHLSVYATDGKTGWVIDCWSSPSYTRVWRPVFKRMIGSFEISGRAA